MRAGYETTATKYIYIAGLIVDLMLRYTLRLRLHAILQRSVRTVFKELPPDYVSVKEDYPHLIQLYQRGNFYEILGEDVDVIAGRVGLRVSPGGMAGFPLQSAGHWIERIVDAGHCAALVHQRPQPQGSEPARRTLRHLTQIITPATISSLSSSDTTVSKPLVAVCQSATDPTEFGILSADMGTYELEHAVVNGLADVFSHLIRLNPAEVLLYSNCPRSLQTCAHFNIQSQSRTSILDTLSSRHDWKNCTRLVRYPVSVLPHEWRQSALAESKHICSKEDLQLVEASLPRVALDALDMVATYLRRYTHKQVELPVFFPPGVKPSSKLALDESVINSLELIEATDSDGSYRRKGSLFGLLARTQTSFGARELKRRLLAPEVNVSVIQQRLNFVSAIKRVVPAENELIRSTLAECDDLSARVGQLSRATTFAQKLSNCSAIRQTLIRANKIHRHLREYLDHLPEDSHSSDDFRALSAELELVPQAKLSDLSNYLSSALAVDPSTNETTVVHEEGSAFDQARLQLGALDAQFYQLRIDALASLREENPLEFGAAASSSALELTEISSLGTVFKMASRLVTKLQPRGCFRAQMQEIPMDKASSNVIFTTKKLNELNVERSHLTMNYKEEELEATNEIMSRILYERQFLHTVHKFLCHLDVTSALALVAHENGYVKPVVDDSLELVITKGRHPILDNRKQGQVEANDLDLSSQRHWILTGANMGGKSTYLKQNALIVIMAQLGSFVPAASAQIGVVDAIFTRLGASDNLTENMSTFMSEMSDVATILQRATSRSFVLLDELGRGTGVLEGMCLALGVIQFMGQQFKCRMLSATHYLGLHKHLAAVPTIGWYRMVANVNDCISFSYRLEPGLAETSHGIAVAQLAGLPNSIVSRAREVKRTLAADSTAGK
eukprot:m.95916 g.95916  ORF g.95916 m.95916 type:complete len:904 (+) comp51310_c0_seq3:38-2749(+)